MHCRAARDISARNEERRVLKAQHARQSPRAAVRSMCATMRRTGIRWKCATGEEEDAWGRFIARNVLCKAKRELCAVQRRGSRRACSDEKGYRSLLPMRASLPSAPPPLPLMPSTRRQTAAKATPHCPQGSGPTPLRSSLRSQTVQGCPYDSLRTGRSRGEPTH